MVYLEKIYGLSQSAYKIKRKSGQNAIPIYREL